ncbi:MAG: histidinol-phosphate transaminase [Candidatus Omnitrophica bacterium]|nr:histidinol-phosphate transaminase [Candidatus Omnitrophota bacterium]
MLVRNHLLGITPYEAGKPIEEVKRQLKLKKIIKLASNENPLGVSPLALKAIKGALSKINRYPDSQNFYLKRALAKHFRLSAENFILGNGSDEIIDIIIKTFVEEKEEILTAEITFLEYRIIAQILKRRVISVPLKDFKYDLTAMKKKISKKTKLVFIANPNNPTGTYINASELKEFFKDLPSSVILVLDEAYDNFIDAEDFGWGLPYLKKKKNLIILKTFSKAYGLAGLRLGFAMAKKEFVSFMERVRQPFNVNSLAQVAGISALKDKDFLLKTRQVILEGKKYLYRELDKLGLKYIPSQANFILIDIKRDSKKFFKEMLKEGIIIRDMKQYGLNNFVRVTIGTERENHNFIRALKKLI